MTKSKVVMKKIRSNTPHYEENFEKIISTSISRQMEKYQPKCTFLQIASTMNNGHVRFLQYVFL